MPSAEDKAQRPEEHEDEDMDEMLAADDAAEEIAEANDVAMDSDNDDDDDDEVVLQNDSIAYFDLPPDSLFAIAQHPAHPSLVALGGSAGPQDDAPGAGWIVDTAAAPARPVLPASYASDPTAAPRRSTVQLDSLFALDGHSDSLNALCWTLPRGDVLVSGGLDGRVRAWGVDVRPAADDGRAVAVTLLGEAREVEEVNWLAACPSPVHPNAVALGASDGSVWVYAIDPSDPAAPLQIVRSYFLHTGSCTAGAWTPDGQLLATVAEDSSLHVWDVWGLAAGQGIAGDGGMTAVSLTGSDQRFEVEGGLYSVAVDPKGAFVAAGGAGGAVKIVSLPRLASPGSTASRSRPQGARGGAKSSAADPSAGGQILASLHAQGESIETLAVALTSSSPPTTLVAAGSVDGSIVVYDANRRFAVRRHIAGAHDEHSVVRLDFVPDSWLLTSCGMDGVVRRWDLRAGGATGSSAAADAGPLKEWRGHRGDGEGGGVLGFVQGQTGERVVTAGDDGLALVFEA